MVKVSETDIAFPEAMLENSSDIFKGLESLIPHQRSAGVTQRGLLGTVGLVWEDEDALQGILSAGHTYRRVLHPKTWVCGRHIRGGWYAVWRASVFSIDGQRIHQFSHLSIPRDFISTFKAYSCFFLPSPRPKPNKVSMFPTIGVNSRDVFTQMNYSKELWKFLQCESTGRKGTWIVSKEILLKIYIRT